jgi:Coenzyme PQQ synthesis protein D (PqqD)
MSVLDKSFVKDDNLMARNIAGETLIVPIRNSIGDLNSIYTLNEVGALIWQMIDERTRVNQIVEAVSNEYDVTTDEAAQDVIELLDSMRTEGLIQPVEEGEA